MRRAKKELLKEIRRLQRENDELSHKSAFYRLLYRTELSFLSQRLGSELWSKKHHRRRVGHSLNVGDIHKFLVYLVERAERDDLCNDICKGMYFCNLKKGHKGDHSYFFAPEPLK